MGNADLGLGWICWTAVQKNSEGWLPALSHHELRSELCLWETLQTFCCTWCWAATQHMHTIFWSRGSPRWQTMRDIQDSFLAQLYIISRQWKKVCSLCYWGGTQLYCSLILRWFVRQWGQDQEEGMECSGCSLVLLTARC